MAVNISPNNNQDDGKTFLEDIKTKREGGTTGPKTSGEEITRREIKFSAPDIPVLGERQEREYKRDWEGRRSQRETRREEVPRRRRRKRLYPSREGEFARRQRERQAEGQGEATIRERRGNEGEADLNSGNFEEPRGTEEEEAQEPTKEASVDLREQEQQYKKDWQKQKARREVKSPDSPQAQAEKGVSRTSPQRGQPQGGIKPQQGGAGEERMRGQQLRQRLKEAKKKKRETRDAARRVAKDYAQQYVKEAAKKYFKKAVKAIGKRAITALAALGSTFWIIVLVIIVGLVIIVMVYLMTSCYTQSGASALNHAFCQMFNGNATLSPPGAELDTQEEQQGYQQDMIRSWPY